MKIFEHSCTFEHAWQDVAVAHWLKYPNPFASHVLSVDVVERRVDEESGVLRTTRLVRKTNSMPRWGRRLFNVHDAYVLEESVVDPRAMTMTTTARNISHRRIMTVHETQRILPHPQLPACTILRTEASIRSALGWGLKSRIESFALKRFGDNTNKSRKGLKWVLEKLHEKQRQYTHALFDQHQPHHPTSI